MKITSSLSDMKRQFLFGFFICFFVLAKASVLIVEGKFQNKNIYIHNGLGKEGVGYCVKEVKVNGHITTDETNSSSFEIDLRALQLKYGEAVTIEIMHSEGCLPKVLNLEDLRPKPSFEVLLLDLSPSGTLKWTTANEMGALPFIIEQYKWNKWVPIGMVEGVGTSEAHEYSFNVAMHSGTNKYRIKQKGFNSFVKISKDITAVSSVNRPSYAITKDLTSVDFSGETAYEVYDAFGLILKKGFGKQIDISNLPKGAYFLCYDNALAEFTK